MPQRVSLLEQDADVFENTLEETNRIMRETNVELRKSIVSVGDKLNSNVSKVYYALIGGLMSLATASILLVIDILVRK